MADNLNARFMGSTDEKMRADSAPRKARKIGEVLRSSLKKVRHVLTNFGTTNTKG